MDGSPFGATRRRFTSIYGACLLSTPLPESKRPLPILGAGGKIGTVVIYSDSRRGVKGLFLSSRILSDPMAVMVGAFARGDAFPSQREMARTYGVPNSTLSDWLNSPEAERFGIVRRTEGRRKAVAAG